MTPLAIDFDALRIGLVRVLRDSMGLNQNQVVMAEPEIPNAPRPALPYFDIKMGTPSIMYGRDWEDVTPVPEKPTFVSTSQGPRGITITFMSFADTHEQACGMMATWQALLGTAAVRQKLHETGIAMWSMLNVEDQSALLDTGYEGRCSLTVTFGTTSRIVSVPSESGVIELASVAGDITVDVSGG